MLTVAVSNAPSDIYPQAADFTFYGGLYRAVNFIEAEEAHFDLLKDGTSGVFVTPHCAGKTRIDLFPVNAEIPFISQFIPSKKAYENTISQMTESRYFKRTICPARLMSLGLRPYFSKTSRNRLLLDQ